MGRAALSVDEQDPQGAHLLSGQAGAHERFEAACEHELLEGVLRVDQLALEPGAIARGVRGHGETLSEAFPAAVEQSERAGPVRETRELSRFA
ncbi:hypothetical protein GCM10009600_20400 [Oerskovia paurometabola]